MRVQEQQRADSPKEPARWLVAETRPRLPRHAHTPQTEALATVRGSWTLSDQKTGVNRPPGRARKTALLDGKAK